MAAVLIDIWFDCVGPCNACAKLHRIGDPTQPENFPPAYLEHLNCGWHPAQFFIVCTRTPGLLYRQATNRQTPQSSRICLDLPAVLLAL